MLQFASQMSHLLAEGEQSAQRQEDRQLHGGFQQSCCSGDFTHSKSDLLACRTIHEHLHIPKSKACAAALTSPFDAGIATETGLIDE